MLSRFKRPLEMLRVLEYLRVLEAVHDMVGRHLAGLAAGKHCQQVDVSDIAAKLRSASAPPLRL